MFRHVANFVSHRLTLATVLGLITWFGINEVTKHETTLTIDDVAIGQNSEWVILEKSVDSVRVNFRGSRNEILRLDPSEVRIEVPLNGNGNDTEILCEILPRHVISPGGVHVVEIIPNQIGIVRSRVQQSREFTLEKVAVRTLADAGTTQLSLEPADVAVKVNGVKDSLDENNLKQIRVFVDCVGLAPASSDDIAVRVDLPPGLQLVSVEPKTVNVQAAALPEPEPEPPPVEPQPDPPKDETGNEEDPVPLAPVDPVDPPNNPDLLPRPNPLPGLGGT